MITRADSENTGTHHAIRGQHSPRYLVKFESHFNRSLQPIKDIDNKL
ncbi:hypothetical protein BDK62_106237 [Halomonas alkaliantarctica]|nr:hypothetical protein BDK62_106237 [Halomonas alkaliantarctica]